MIRFGKRTLALGSAAALLAAGGAVAAAQSVQAAPATPTCQAGDLYLAVGSPQGAAGSFLYPVEFTNTSTHSCALRGYPGVSVLTTGHAMIGAPATRNGVPASTVVLAPARTAAATIRTNDPGVVPSCRTTSTYLGVYPPASTQQMLVPYHLRVCGLFEISPVQSS
ncbi:DUF4232 domain-containing protein [Kitasatospora sp. NPDC085895]|uniref:DUF4232 domain-containing protein n=1 Tax=Kitasatospora sp. NPDC085895 TaxID=3155057 RepID=UPI00344B64B2